MNFDLSEIIELVKNGNKTLDAFFASHDVQKNESQPRPKTASNLVRVLTLIRFLSDSFIYQMLALFWPMSEKKQISSLSLTHTHTHTALVFITDFGSLATLLKIQEWEWGFTTHLVWIPTVSNRFLACLCLFFSPPPPAPDFFRNNMNSYFLI